MGRTGTLRRCAAAPNPTMMLCADTARHYLGIQNVLGNTAKRQRYDTGEYLSEAHRIRNTVDGTDMFGNRFVHGSWCDVDNFYVTVDCSTKMSCGEIK